MFKRIANHLYLLEIIQTESTKLREAGAGKIERKIKSNKGISPFASTGLNVTQLYSELMH